MPNYEFKCRECGRVFECIVPSDKRTTICLPCDIRWDGLKGETADRLPSAPSFSVRGGTPKFHEKGRK